MREADEWFDEPDDIERVARALRSIDNEDDPVVAAATVACRVAHTQGFSEGNKRTGLLLARWVLDRNGVPAESVMPADDRDLADLLIRAASGLDVLDDVVQLFKTRAI